MPFQSQAQRRYLFAVHPEIAKKWAKKYPVKKDLPEHKKKGLYHFKKKKNGSDS